MRNTIHMEANVLDLGKENIQESLEISRHYTECDSPCANLKRLPYLSLQKYVATERDLTLTRVNAPNTCAREENTSLLE